jgi:hypothetical protein
MSHSIPDKSAGSTPRGTKAPWKQFGSHSLFIDVDTSAAGFATTPHYVTALNGYHSHWRTVGAHSLYTPSSTGFRVYLLYELSTITVKEAQQWDWSINWIGSFGETVVFAAALLLVCYPFPALYKHNCTLHLRAYLLSIGA